MAHDLLNGCLVDGDLEQRKRERKIRRRALAISISLQAAALAVNLRTPGLDRIPRQIDQRHIADELRRDPPWHAYL